jgi:predicted nucleic acid-binding protein
MGEKIAREQLAQVKTWLLDAGPIVALLNPRDPEHDSTSAILDGFRGNLATTGAVITEAFHLLRRHSNGSEHLLRFLEASRMTVVECCQADQLRRAVRLMTKYRDTPMDFADATLVLLAERLDQYEICTLDRRGFSTFRTSSGKSLRIIVSGT